MKSELSSRLKRVLELVVQDYIRTAEPVGSEGLVSRYKLGLSSATIRKVMAELEELGLLAQPHASSGRMPTEEGLSIYVSEILEIGRLSQSMRALIDQQMTGRTPRMDSILSLCSKVLSNLTRHMSVVAAPALERLVLKGIHFIRLAAGEILTVIIDENGLTRNKVLSQDQDLSQDELNQVNAYLEGIAPRSTIDELKRKILKAMEADKSSFGSLYARALELADRALAVSFEGGDEQRIFVEGQGNLLEYPEFAETLAMKSLFKAFEDKRRIVELLNEVADEGRVRIVVGSEAAKAALDGLALVASPYTHGDQKAGALGIIGPQRLNYSEIVPVVDYAARVVSELLEAENK